MLGGHRNVSMEVKLDDRVFVGGTINDFATVKFYGLTDFAEGYWVGLELDNKIGKNDGSVNGVRYFNMADREDFLNHGLFTRVEQIRSITEAESQLLSKLNQTTNQLAVLINQQKKIKQSYESQIEDLVSTINNLSLHETDFLSKENELMDKLEKLKEENLNLRQELLVWKTLEDDSNGPINLNDIDVKKLFTQNKQFQRIIENLKDSSNDVIRQYEKSLEDNTNLVKQNIELNNKVSELSLENKHSTVLITELKERLDSIDQSDNIIQYLTETNNDLTVNINELNGKLSEKDAIIEELKSAHSNQDKIQSEMDALKHELNLTISILESEYEKAIIVTDELNNSKNKIADLKNQNIVLKREIERMNLYKKIGKFILNKSDNISLDLFLIQFQIFQIILSWRNFNKEEEINFQLNLYLQITSSIATYLKRTDNINLVYEMNMNNILQDLVNLFKDWNNCLLNGNNVVHLNDSHLNIIFDTMTRLLSSDAAEDYNSNNKLEFSVIAIDDIFKNIIPKVLTNLSKTVDKKIMHHVYDKISNINKKLESLLGIFRNQSKIFSDDFEINIFKSIIEEFFQILISIPKDDGKEFINIINKFNNYLLEIEIMINQNTNMVTNITDYELSTMTIPKIKKISDSDSCTVYHDDIMQEAVKERAEQEQLVNELQLKINVLTEKANESKIRDKINIELKDEIKDLTAKLDEENSKVRNYTNEINELKKDLKELKFDNIQIIKDRKLINNFLTIDELNKMDLLTEIHYLKDNVLNKMQTDNFKKKSVNKPLEWLRKDELLYEKKQTLDHSSLLHTDQLDINMDRLLKNLSKLVDEVILHDLPINKDKDNKVFNKIQRYDNIVKNSIKEF